MLQLPFRRCRARQRTPMVHAVFPEVFRHGVRCLHTLRSTGSPATPRTPDAPEPHQAVPPRQQSFPPQHTERQRKTPGVLQPTAQSASPSRLHGCRSRTAHAAVQRNRHKRSFNSLSAGILQNQCNLEASDRHNRTPSPPIARCSMNLPIRAGFCRGSLGELTDSG